jgi:RNA polymerase sigma factor (sigma-70 family)
MTGDTPDAFLQTRLSLIQRLKSRDDNESWQEFLNIYSRMLHNVALRSGLTEVEAQDAVQETVISMVKTMPGFKYDPAVCSFKTWLQLLARKRIADQFRKRVRVVVSLAAPGDPAGEEAESVPDPKSLDRDAVWNAEWQKCIFDTAVQRVKGRASVEQFQIFDCYVLREWPLKRVVSTLGVSSAQVYLAKHRVMRLIKREARRLEKQGV